MQRYFFKFRLCVIVGLELQPGAAGFQLSNPPVLETVSLLASLNVSVVIVIIIAYPLLRALML